MQSSTEVASQRPAVPTYILRGHNAPIHSLQFLSSNLYLVSGDSEGWLVVWSLSSKRPVAIWKAHDSGVTGIKAWQQDRLITHGRDHKLRVWQVNFEDTSSLSIKLPVDGATDDQPKPWLLHVMDVSALNFCTFATCVDHWAHSPSPEESNGLLIATPNGLDSGGIDISHLPSQHRVSQLPSDKSNNTGMVMAIKLFCVKQDNSLRLVSGYEDGQVMVHCHPHLPSSSSSKWQKLMAVKAHSQPVLSLDISTSKDYFFITSSADAQIAKLAIPDPSAKANAITTTPLKSVNTKHAGQQGLSIRSDGKIFATAGWDARVRVYSTKSIQEMAVLKWHKDGCYSTAFAEIRDESDSEGVLKSNVESRQVTNRSALDAIRDERSVKAQRMHWLAAGGKDGKISLWDIY